MQSILPEQFSQLMDECSQIAAVLHRQVPRGIHVEESAGVAVTVR
jgi:3-deoxy-7-phosphoheptulonate synthase